MGYVFFRSGWLLFCTSMPDSEGSPHATTAFGTHPGWKRQGRGCHFLLRRPMVRSLDVQAAHHSEWKKPPHLSFREASATRNLARASAFAYGSQCLSSEPQWVPTTQNRREDPSPVMPRTPMVPSVRSQAACQARAASSKPATTLKEKKPPPPSMAALPTSCYSSPICQRPLGGDGSQRRTRRRVPSPLGREG